jgi:hypothetical protein
MAAKAFWVTKVGILGINLMGFFDNPVKEEVSKLELPKNILRIGQMSCR